MSFGSCASSFFSPRYLSPILLLDGNDPNGNGTVPADTTHITNWVDKSGNGNNATAVSNFGVYKVNIVNGRNVVRFNGVTSILSSACNIDYTVNPNLTIFVVWQLNSGGSSTQQALWGQDNGGFDRFATLVWSSFSPGLSSGSAAVSVPFFATVGSFQIMAVQMQNGVTNGSMAWKNRNSSPDVTYTESHSNSGTNTLFIGSLSSATSWTAKVDICQFIIYPNVLTATQLLQVQTYLGNLYGL